MLQPTSTQAYNETKKEGMHLADHKLLLDAYYWHGDKCDRDMADILGWEKARVSARRDKLVKSDPPKVKYKKKFIHPKTEKEVIVWGLVTEIKQEELF